MADDRNAASWPTGGPASGSKRAEAPTGADDRTAEEVLADVSARSGEPRDPDVPAAIPDPETWLSALEGRSSAPGVCPFLRSVGPGDSIVFPVESPDVTNRCAALREPVPQSLRQQELVCLTSGHINCPRYLRGALVASESPLRRLRLGPAVTPAIAAALVVLGLSFGVSVGFVVANGGLTLPVALVATATPSGSAAAVGPTPAPTAQVTPAATIAAAPTPSPPLSSATPGPTVTPAATPPPTPKPTKTPKPHPSSNRYDLLKPCPDKPDCWIYVIRSGDNLFSIANYFGVPIERVRALNPWTRTESLRAGRELILPPPTR